MSQRLLKAAGRLRVLYGATKPLPKPPGRYHADLTDEDHMREFEARQRRSPGYNERLQAGIAADRALFGKRT